MVLWAKKLPRTAPLAPCCSSVRRLSHSLSVDGREVLHACQCVCADVRGGGDGKKEGWRDGGRVEQGEARREGEKRNDGEERSGRREERERGVEGTGQGRSWSERRGRGSTVVPSVLSSSRRTGVPSRPWMREKTASRGRVCSGCERRKQGDRREEEEERGRRLRGGKGGRRRERV
eukprot:752162-Hanusia_phi.AAC.5